MKKDEELERAIKESQQDQTERQRKEGEWEKQVKQIADIFAGSVEIQIVRDYWEALGRDQEKTIQALIEVAQQTEVIKQNEEVEQKEERKEEAKERYHAFSKFKFNILRMRFHIFILFN